MRGILPVAVMLTFLLVIPVGMVTAESETNTVSLTVEDKIVIEMDIEGSTRITYDVEVNTGPNVNVWFLEHSDYSDYARGGDFQYYFLYSNEDVSSASEDFTWSEDGLHYIVIDNRGNANPDASTRVTYTVEWGEGGVGTFAYVLVFVVLVVVAIIGIEYMRSASKRKREEARTPPMDPHDPLNEYALTPMPKRRKLPPSDQGPGYIPQDSGYDNVDRTKGRGP